jgi:hypothetical protein
MPKRLDIVRVTADGRDIETSWKRSRQLEGRLVSGGHQEAAQEFANKGTSRPIVLDRPGKRALLGAVFSAMQERATSSRATSLNCGTRCALTSARVERNRRAGAQDRGAAAGRMRG